MSSHGIEGIATAAAHYDASKVGQDMTATTFFTTLVNVTS